MKKATTWNLNRRRRTDAEEKDIRRHVFQLGWSQADVAKKFGCSTSTVSTLCGGAVRGARVIERAYVE